MIRLAFFVDSPSKRAHGNAVSRLALGLAATGQADTTIVCYRDDPPPAWLPQEVRIHRLGSSRASRSVAGLAGYLRDQSPDVLITRQVHANFAGLAAAWMARVPPRWAGKLVLVQDQFAELCHAANWRDNKWLAKAAYRFADGLIAPSPEVRDDTVRWCGLDPSSAGLVPNAIPEFRGPLGQPPHPWLAEGEPPVFAHVSNLFPSKRADLLIDAFAELRRSHDARLLIIGEGAERASADQQIRRLSLTGCAETTGWTDDPLQFLARAHALVHTSDEDGFAQVLPEAMSVGCPVITADSLGGGPRFVTAGGSYGVLVARGDRAGFTVAMERMLRPEVRAEYSELGRRRSAELSPAACAGALTSFLAESLAMAA